MLDRSQVDNRMRCSEVEIIASNPDDVLQVMRGLTCRERCKCARKPLTDQQIAALLRPAADAFERGAGDCVAPLARFMGEILGSRRERQIRGLLGSAAPSPGTITESATTKAPMASEPLDGGKV
jgi:hypothetical protein